MPDRYIYHWACIDDDQDNDDDHDDGYVDNYVPRLRWLGRKGKNFYWG